MTGTWQVYPSSNLSSATVSSKESKKSRVQRIMFQCELLRQSYSMCKGVSPRGMLQMTEASLTSPNLSSLSSLHPFHLSSYLIYIL